MDPNVNSETTINTFPGNKKKFYIAGIIGILICAAVLGYWYWTKTPQYSLNLIKDAISNHDLPAFEKHVDIESLVSRAIDQVIDAKLNDPNEIQDDQVKNFAAGLIKMLKPQLVTLAKDEIKSFVEKGKFESKPVTQHSNQENNKISTRELFGSAEGAQYQGIDYTKTDGKIALVGLKLFYPKLNQSAILELKMREMDGYWQLAELNNLNAFLLKLEAAEKARLAEINKPIIEEINKAVKIEGITVSKVNNGEFSRQVIYNAKINFPDSKQLKDFTGVLLVKNKDGKILLNEPVRATNLASANKTGTIAWKKEINPFIKAEQVLFDSAVDQTVTQLNLTRLVFADGTELKLAEKLSN